MTAERLTGRADWPQRWYLADGKAVLFTGHHEKPGMFQPGRDLYPAGHLCHEALAQVDTLDVQRILVYL